VRPGLQKTLGKPTGMLIGAPRRTIQHLSIELHPRVVE
jgi:hypothetical protein